MINIKNLKDLLRALNFEESGNVFSKYFTNPDAYLKVDFERNELIYPTDKGFKVNGEFTCNFSSDENFVVFECVNRLFEKGYKPEHIELEPKWKVGHGASGGRADILVKDNSDKSLLIIECKTEGTEFRKEWNNTLQRGGQMLTYAKQAGTTQYVCLYASDFVDGKVIYFSNIISLNDNEKLLQELADKKPLSFKEAKALEVEDIYRAWKETYNLDFATKGIFEDDIQAYHIGKQKYTIDDLVEIGSKDIQSKYHEFATIMRQHNVSGRENAFDKLVNLFLCKIVDEAKNPKDLKFNWKGIAYDSYFDLQDRLQLLYQAGMKEFLGEDVTYIDNNAIDKAFRFFKKDPDATRETIKKYFRQLKFFTNNDFAFIDVHNEKLFYQNSEVLLKIVQMLQDTRLQSETQNQFLGDMFEGFLDNGVKQSEGQFFTPMPIVKFILNSLPLESIIKESELPPKAIDYACGAGHFLNELALQIKPFVERHKQTDIVDYYKKIVGIEKEYRLSKVSKVSAFMYGQDEIKIVYADALASNEVIADNEYSILVANPPYSVKGFLQTIKEADRNKYSILNSIEEKSFANNTSIETFFVERAKQLLKPDSVAGIIVPPSILTRGRAKITSKKKNVYVASREILLKYFDIVAIAEFGSGTFGKTGTSTVTLFLRRKKENPASADHYFNRVESWFKGDKSKNGIFEDVEFIKSYCERAEIDFKEYALFLENKLSEEFFEFEIVKQYLKEFEKWGELKDLKKSKSFKELPTKEQKEKTDKLLYEFIASIEKEKLYYFILASLNPQNVLVIRSPSKNAEMKDFLGYEWSAAKGNEGIKYLGKYVIDEPKTENEDDDGIVLEDDDKRVLNNLLNLNNISTPLYDPNDRYNSKKINYLIEKNFNNEQVTIPEELIDFVTELSLVEMIDFSTVDFNKKINLIQKNKVIIKTKWDLVRLGDITDVKNGGTPDTNNPSFWNGGNICWATLVDTKQKYLTDTKKKITDLGLKNSSAVLLPVNTVIFSSRATIGEVTINKVPATTNQGYKNFVCDPNKIDFEYLYYLLVHYKKEIESIIPPSTKYKEINATDIKNFKIPLPPLTEQKKLVSQLLKFEEEKNKLLEPNMDIEKYENLIKQRTAEIINEFIL